MKHKKRNKGGHKFEPSENWVCECGLTLYDWKCKWFWS